MTSGRPDTRTEEGRQRAFSLELRRRGGSEVLALERVLASDLGDLSAEALWRAATCRGRPDLSLEEAVSGPFPATSGADARSCLAFRVGLDPATAVEITFPLESLAPVARRAATRLLAAGVLRAGDEFVYALRLAAAESRDIGGLGSGSVRAVAPVKRTLPALERRELAPLLAGAEAVDAEHALPGEHAVVFARPALARARAIAERGLSERPAIETGGVLLGRRAACPVSGEAYVLVEEALEAQHTLAKEFSLEFLGESWRRFEQVLARRRAQPATATQLLIGQFHCHPFLPDGGLPPCADCARRAVCTRSSARPSSDDARWCRAVFHEAPWQLSLMFGLDARGERRVELYGQRAGALERRGYHLVDALSASVHATAGSHDREPHSPHPDP